MGKTEIYRQIYDEYDLQQVHGNWMKLIFSEFEKVTIYQTVMFVSD